ncbi:hypothetical protein [Rhodococcus sp. IEGM 1330]|uniref:hypothetical protein n=1 Tax=Rhodococcus sp. IEGM 1330 TaxID=3082225 RepID=UPI0029549B85|nr:hypothetical protein [Rhodococcus sp. IEGM 1330]MDV8025237.1 hypothetical protein [Rhodococcus sp. IEGM 1330]
MADRRHPAQWWIWLTAPTAVFVFFVCGVVLWAFLPPVVFFPFLALAAWALLVLGAVWLILALVGWFRYRALRWSVVAPVLVVLTVGLVLLSVPPKFAFAVSEDALTDVAVDCPKTWEDKRIGLYSVQYVRPVDNGCLFFIEGGLIDSIGLGYFPDVAPPLGEPEHDRDIGYQEFDGDWYLFVQRF